jgi:hypothetical protein
MFSGARTKPVLGRDGLSSRQTEGPVEKIPHRSIHICSGFGLIYNLPGDRINLPRFLLFL